MGGSSANRLTNQSGGLNGDTLGATGGRDAHAAPQHRCQLTITVSAAHSTTSLPGTRQRSRQWTTTDRRYWLCGANTTSANTAGHSITIANKGDGDAHNNVQPTIILNYVIKT